MMLRLFTLVFLLFFLATASGQSFDYLRTVRVQASVSETPPAIHLQWPVDATSTGFILYRRPAGAGGWGPSIASLPAAATAYSDTTVEIGVAYEYQVFKTTTNPGINGHGYIRAGIRIPAVLSRGIVLLVVDSTFSIDLDPELDRWTADLEGEGWRVKRLDVSPDASVPEVKDQIEALYDEDPDQTRSLFLVGHVPVPYSGEIYPDGHPDHQGAWPADGFYGEMNGAWTDNAVNNTVANSPRNKNTPSDGKYDQSAFPSNVELEVGRVDFSNLPALPWSELDMLKAYFNKNHAFRTKAFEPVRRGLVENNFGSYEEGFGQNGIKNFAPLFGADSVAYLDYQATLQGKSYLWSYGCGAGSYTSAGGITNTTNFGADSLQTVFTMLFGSYFGDWDSQNNLLRAALSSGQTLINAWAGRPNWAFHHMALGETVGYCARITMNNTASQYSTGFGAKSVHIALMGDPTLTLFQVAPPANLTVVEDQSHALLSWEASSDAAEGYLIFRKAAGEEDFQLLTPEAVADLAYVDSCLQAGLTYEYLVRALKLETSASGTYFNLSGAARDTVTVLTDLTVSASFEPNLDGATITPNNLSQNATSYFWDFGDGQTSTEPAPVHTFQVNGQYPVTLTASNDCNSATTTVFVDITAASTAEALAGAGWAVFPNPATGFWVLQNEWAESRLFRLFDSAGREVLQGWAPGHGRVQVPVPGPGLYWLQAGKTVVGLRGL